MDNFDSFLQEHKKIDEKLVNTKQSKLFLIKSKTKRVRKSNSLSSFHSHSKPGLYELDNSSRGTLPHKLIRKISRRSPGSLRPVESAKQTYLPETLNEESSLASSTDGLNDKDVVTYKKVFKAETEDARDEVFQFQFEFTKLKLDDDKLKFSDDVNNAIQKQDFEENKSTTLISNSNGNVITTTIKPKQLKKIFPGFGISNGIASLYTSIFGWSKSG